jgi:hypothetical protein
VTATPLPDGQGTRITLNNGGYQDVKQLIADVLNVADGSKAPVRVQRGHLRSAPNS